MKAEDIVTAYLNGETRKRQDRSYWKENNSEQYQAGLKLYDMGYSVASIAKHIGCTYDTFRKTLIRDGKIVPRKYRTRNDLHTTRHHLCRDLCAGNECSG